MVIPQISYPWTQALYFERISVSSSREKRWSNVYLKIHLIRMFPWSNHYNSIFSWNITREYSYSWWEVTIVPSQCRLICFPSRLTLIKNHSKSEFRRNLTLTSYGSDFLMFFVSNKSIYNMEVDGVFSFAFILLVFLARFLFKFFVSLFKISHCSFFNFLSYKCSGSA